MLPILASLVLMNTASTVIVQVRSEARERIEKGDSSLARTNDSALELEVAPTLGYTLQQNEGNDTLSLLYVPRFILPSATKAITFDLSDRKNKFSTFHNGGLALQRVRPSYRLEMLALGAFGSVTTAALLYQAPWRGEHVPETPQVLLPADRSVRFAVVFYQLQAAPTIRLDPKVHFTPMVRYNAFGGADSNSRETIPLTRGPQGELKLEVKPTRRETWTSVLGGAYTTVLAAQTDVNGVVIGDRQAAPVTNAVAEQSYAYKVSRPGEVEFGGGATVSQVRTQGLKLSPVGHAQYVHRTPHARYAAVLRQGPWLNLFAGEYEPRTELTVASHVDISPKWIYRGQASALRTLGSLESISRYTLFVGDTAGGYKLTRDALLELGVRAGVQDMTNSQFDSRTLQGIGYVSFTYAPENPIRL